MVVAAFRYPFRGPWLHRTALGSLLLALAPLVVPALVLAGYCLRVLETTLADEGPPPTFGDWARLARRGLGGAIVAGGFLVGPVAAVGIGLAALAGGGYGALAGVGRLLGRAGTGEVAVWTISLLAALVAALAALVAVAAVLASYALLPAALARYAATGSIRAAFDRQWLWATARSREYLAALVVLQVVPVGVAIVAAVAALTVVGLLAIPAIGFCATLGCCRLTGEAVRSASAGTPAAGPS